MAWSLGAVGHFGLAVRDPKKSARWWTKNLGLKRAFTFEDGVALENDAIPGDEIGPEAPGSPHLGLWFHDPDGYRWELSVQNALKRHRKA